MWFRLDRHCVRHDNRQCLASVLLIGVPYRYQMWAVGCGLDKLWAQVTTRTVMLVPRHLYSVKILPGTRYFSTLRVVVVGERPEFPNVWSIFSPISLCSRFSWFFFQICEFIFPGLFSSEKIANCKRKPPYILLKSFTKLDILKNRMSDDTNGRQYKNLLSNKGAACKIQLPPEDTDKGQRWLRAPLLY